MGSITRKKIFLFLVLSFATAITRAVPLPPSLSSPEAGARALKQWEARIDELKRDLKLQSPKYFGKNKSINKTIAELEDGVREAQTALRGWKLNSNSPGSLAFRKRLQNRLGFLNEAYENVTTNVASRE